MKIATNARETPKMERIITQPLDKFCRTPYSFVLALKMYETLQRKYYIYIYIYITGYFLVNTHIYIINK